MQLLGLCVCFLLFNTFFYPFASHPAMTFIITFMLRIDAGTCDTDWYSIQRASNTEEEIKNK